jgi:hypothetical protein
VPGQPAFLSSAQQDRKVSPERGEAQAHKVPPEPQVQRDLKDHRALKAYKVSPDPAVRKAPPELLEQPEQMAAASIFATHSIPTRRMPSTT